MTTIRAILKCIAATLAAGLAPALVLLALPGATIGFAVITFIIATVHAVFLGLPAYFFVSNFGRVKAPLAALIGCAVGMIPIMLLLLSVHPDMARVDGVATYVDGMPTMAGLLNILAFAGIAGCFGAVGAFAFWLTLACGREHAVKSAA